MSYTASLPKNATIPHDSGNNDAAAASHNPSTAGVPSSANAEFLGRLEKALLRAAEKNNILLMLFFFHVKRSIPLEAEMDDLKEKIEKEHKELQLLNRFSHQVQEHAKEAAQYLAANKKESLEGTKWESISYILDADYAEVLKGHEILKTTKDQNSDAYLNWKNNNPSAAKSLEDCYQRVASIKEKEAEGFWSKASYAASYLKPSSYFADSDSNDSKAKIIINEETIKKAEELLPKPIFTPHEVYRIKALCKSYGFSEDNILKALNDPKGQFGAAANILATTAKSIDTKISKFATELHSKTSDSHTLIDLYSSTMKMITDSIKTVYRNM